MARFLPADHSKGDANTVGGYQAVHGRPAAFEGSDGASYSVEIEVEATGEPEHAYAAYFLFLRWRRIGPQGVEGHVESEPLAHGTTADEARRALGAMPLAEVKAVLDACIASRGGPSGRKWWDVMRDEDGT